MIEEGFPCGCIFRDYGKGWKMIKACKWHEEIVQYETVYADLVKRGLITVVIE